MWTFPLILASLLTLGKLEGEFSILNQPRSISFKGHHQLKESTLGEVYSASLGFSNSQFSNWDGMFISNPFYMAEAIATVSVEGVSSINLIKGHNFPLKTDLEDENIFEIVRDRINLRYPEADPKVFHINLQNGLEDVSGNDLFKNIKNIKPRKSTLQFLKNNAEDREFLREIDLLNSIADQVPNSLRSDGVPDLFWFKVSSLHPLVDLYGDNSTEIKEAKKLLNEAIYNLNIAFKKAYNGAVLFSVISSDASHTRRTRSILADAPDTDMNLAADYSEDFPIIFNIILWLSIVLAFSLFAIILFIAEMDPGRIQ
ncbi:hypothetical protein HHI36_016248 [Cryptolaemus montrouzieri]|uniref:Renin receptor n=1 Tax=Cryptolaemus montrouzieri TaxID=559131 RepID=A0ABD2NIX8_9CUCU